MSAWKEWLTGVSVGYDYVYMCDMERVMDKDME